MAVFKCKMCGAQLDVLESTIVTCDFCGSQQTLPRLNDDKLEKLYERASNLRQGNEFDKAMAVYEEILKENPDDSESYWSIVLCKYGIEYVEDPMNHKRVPTVNRTQYTSIFDDNNYKLAIQYADFAQRTIYEDEAKAINEIQRGILEISQKEDPFDVFICYKETDERGARTRDSVYANELYHELTNEGFKVFFSRITLEDKLGVAYEPYIFAALNSAKVMVVLGTKPEFFNAVWVKNEWSRYLNLIKSGEKKVLIPAYKDMDPYDLPKEFSHLQAQDMNKLGFMPDLIRGIEKILGYKKRQASYSEPYSAPQRGGAAPAAAAANPAALLKRAYIFLEDQDWKNAREYCERVLDIEPENADAYICKLLALVGGTEESHLAYSAKPLDTYPSYKNALRFADDETAQRLVEYNAQVKERIANEEAEREAIRQQKREEAEREAQRRAEEKALRDAEKQRKREEEREEERKLNSISNLSTEKSNAKKRISELKNEKADLIKKIEKKNKQIYDSEDAKRFKKAFAFSVAGTAIALIVYIIVLIFSMIPYVGWLLGAFIYLAMAGLNVLCSFKAFGAYKKNKILAIPNALCYGAISLAFGIALMVQSKPESVEKRVNSIAKMKKRADAIDNDIELQKKKYNEAARKIENRKNGIEEIPSEAEAPLPLSFDGTKPSYYETHTTVNDL